MAAPKPGSRGYKGPVHEAVRSALGGLISAPAKPAAPRPSVKPQTLADRSAIAAGNRRNATAAARNKGTYYSYDPLSSIKVPTPKPTVPKPKMTTVSRKRKG